MDAQYHLSRDELESHLWDQVGFLRSSCEAFDRGAQAEAKRIALTIRVLVHDTNNSKSLLEQLGRKSEQFLDTVMDLVPESAGAQFGLVMIAARFQHSGEPDYVPLLEKATGRWVPFGEWWHRPVFVDDARTAFTREDVILTVADQDGGAHVDPAVDAAYRRLTKENALGWGRGTASGLTPLGDPIPATVRQIAHELFNTLRETPPKPPLGRVPAALFGSVTLTTTVPSSKVWPIVGRNAPCPCGSAKKYKRCHGNP